MYHLLTIAIFLVFVPLIAVSQAQCIRIRSGNNGQQQPGGCTTVEDLSTLLTIIRALEDREYPRSAVCNAEGIIMQLINALVYATTGGGGIIGGYPGVPGTTGGIGTNGGTGTTGGIGTNGGTGTTGGNGYYNYPDDSLINLRLLENDDLLRLFLGGKSIIDLGLGQDNTKDGNGGIVSDLVNAL